MAFDHLSTFSVDIMSPLAGGALLFPKGFWEPGSLSVHKGHFGQGITVAPFLASLNVGPSVTSPLSINTLGLEVLTGVRNVFGSDIKIGSDLKFGALDVSYTGVNNDINAIKSAVSSSWSATAPIVTINGITILLNSPLGLLNGLWLYNGSNICAPCPSDQTAKTNVVNLESSLDKVLSLRGVSFDWNPEVVPKKAEKQKSSIGLIAQEVEKVIPEVVVTEKIEDKDLKTVEYENLVAVLVEAIKEQQQQIEELKERVATLEGNK